MQVVDGPRDRPESVERNETNVHDGRGAEQDVHGRVHVAPHLAKHPVSHELRRQREGHDEHADHRVGDCQRGDEPVLNARQVVLGEDGDDDEDVADEDDNHHCRDDDGQDDDGKLRVTAREGRHNVDAVLDVARRRVALHCGPVPLDLVQSKLCNVKQTVVVVREVVGQIVDVDCVAVKVVPYHPVVGGRVARVECHREWNRVAAGDSYLPLLYLLCPAAATPSLLRLGLISLSGEQQKPIS